MSAPSFLSPDYKEEQLRLGFVVWRLEFGVRTFPEVPVIHEESLKACPEFGRRVAGATKAPADGSPLTAHGLPLSDSDSGPSAVSRKPTADADCGIEHYAFLQSLVNGERVYPHLVRHFRDAVDGSRLAAHNQRLPNPEPSAVSRKPIAVPDGQVYEQFLGKVTRLTPSHQARHLERANRDYRCGRPQSSRAPAVA